MQLERLDENDPAVTQDPGQDARDVRGLLGSLVRSHAGHLVIGGLVGLLSFHAAIADGLRFVAGTAPFWDFPRLDIKGHLIGYLHFLHAPWGWPIGTTHTVDAPHGVNVAMTDSVPMVAVLAKGASSIAPASLRSLVLRPYGLWLLAVYVLQGVTSARFFRWLGVRSTIALVAGTIIACSFSAFVFRFGHLALNAHFFVVWALSLVVRARTEPPSLARAFEVVMLVGLSALTHPYLLAICSALVAAWIVTTALFHRPSRRVVAAAAGGGAVVVFAIYASLGLLRSGAVGARPWGYGYASFNPAGLFLSPFSVVGRVLPTEAADATRFQYEGCAYLGLGLAGLAAAAFVVRRRELSSTMRRHGPLLVVLAGLALFALSNRIHVGKVLVFSFELPAAIEGAVVQFRSTGRFVWPAAYALLFFAVATVARAHRTGGPAALAVAAVVQLIDVSPFYRNTRLNTDGPDPTMLSWSAWDAVLGQHRALFVEPTFDCAYFLREVNLVSASGIHELSFLSARRGMEVNTILTPRTRHACPDEIREREAIVVRDGTLYVLMRRVATGHALANLEGQGAVCTPFDDGYACSRAFNDTAVLERFTRSSPAAAYVLGTALSFGREGATGRIEGPGWGIAEATAARLGDAYEGSRTTLHFVFDREPRSTSYWLDLELDVDEANDLLVEANGVPVGSIALQPGRSHAEVGIPGDFPGNRRYVAIDLQSRGPARVMARSVVLR